ncbi:MAG: protein translocase subunit SecF [Proteobacteria bacterium]|nr:protein translocase subunit SecF [Pseudomonadota bacterium]
MEFFRSNTKIRFMRQRIGAAIFSAVIFIASIIALATQGLTLGLDFTGGSEVSIQFQQPVDAEQIRQKLAASGFSHAVVQSYTRTELSIRVPPQKGLTQEQLQQQISSALPGAHISSSDFIGPQVSKNLLTNGILAVIVALLATMAYIAFRFEYRFALAAAVALIHDPVLILGIFSFFHITFDMIVLTGLLTVIGYSLNDTIVVYDRVRENFRKVRKGTPLEIMDLSINQTLSRTIMTSGLTLVVVLSLLFFGGQMIHGFALAMVIGIVIGTYSSIYVAGSLAVALGLDRKHLQQLTKKLEDELP